MVNILTICFFVFYMWAFFFLTMATDKKKLYWKAQEHPARNWRIGVSLQMSAVSQPLSLHSITTECLLKCSLQWRWMRVGNCLDDISWRGTPRQGVGHPLLRLWKNNDVQACYLSCHLVIQCMVGWIVYGWTVTLELHQFISQLPISTSN